MERWPLSWMQAVRYWYAEHEKFVNKFQEPRGGGWLTWPTQPWEHTSKGECVGHCQAQREKTSSSSYCCLWDFPEGSRWLGVNSESPSLVHTSLLQDSPSVLPTLMGTGCACQGLCSNACPGNVFSSPVYGQAQFEQCLELYKLTKINKSGQSKADADGCERSIKKCLLI